MKGVVNGDIPQTTVHALLTADDHEGLVSHGPMEPAKILRGPKKPKRKMKDRGQIIMHY